MKKMLAGLAVVFLLLLVAGFFLIPSQPVVRKMITVAGPQPAVFRAFTDPMLLQQWLSSGSGKISTSNDTLVYTDGKLRMLISPGMLHVAQVIISKNEKAYNSTVNIIAVSQSESAIEWKAVFPLASNPVSRLRNYFAAKQTANRMQQVLEKFRSFLSKTENLYGLKIQPTRVTDTLLAATQTLTPAEPTPLEYYVLIEKVKEHVARNGARETNYPMLHINRQDTGKYSVMVAIPINRRINESNGIAIKRMVPGNLLVADTKGGPHTIRRALQQFQYYIAEQQFSTPAISYQLLVTDRLQQKDTAQWVTRLCFPVY